MELGRSRRGRGRAQVRASTCSTPPSSSRGRWGRWVKGGQDDAESHPDNFPSLRPSSPFLPPRRPRIDFTNDPRLQGPPVFLHRHQLRRFGPNFPEIPINHSLKPGRQQPATTFARDHQQARFRTSPRAWAAPARSPPGRRRPSRSGGPQGAPGPQGARRSPSFSDHFQPASSSGTHERLEKDHIAAAFSFATEPVVYRGRAQSHHETRSW